MTADEDWRVEVEVGAHGPARRLLERIHERRVAREAHERLGDDVSISVDAHKMFAYAPDERSAREAAAVLEELATREGLEPAVSISRWHPVEERWEAPEVPLPRTEAERQAEHDRRQARERAASREAGFPEWEVELGLPSSDRAAEVAAALEREGVLIGRRGEAVVLGAETEDEARALAERLRGELPDATSIEAKGSEAGAWAQLRPFPYLGGLGG